MIVQDHPEPSAVVARAPVRVSFGGGGTDLSVYYEKHSGLVVSTTINRYCYALARPASDGGIHITSADFGVWQSFRRGQIPEPREPLSLPKAVLAWFAEQSLLPQGVELFLASEVGAGTGLGSSSAICVAMIRALAAYAGLSLSTEQIAEQACHVEIGRLEMPIGKQDQYASAFGGLNTIHFSGDGVAVRPLHLPPRVRDDLSRRLLLFSTGQTHNSADILQKQRSNTEHEPLVLERLHRLKRLAGRMCDALTNGELDQFGQLLHESWQTKKQLSDGISNGDIDRWYTVARRAGAVGGKISGAGGGGFLLLYCPLKRQRAVRQHLGELGLQEMPFAFDNNGAHLLTQPVPAGASRPTGNGNQSNEAPPRAFQHRDPIENYWTALTETNRRIPYQALHRAVDLLSDCHQRRGTVFVVGDGGGATTAVRFARDLTRNALAADATPLRVIALVDNARLSAGDIRNSEHQETFKAQLAALMGSRDLLVIMSSGSGEYALDAAEIAHHAGATTLALIGPQSNRLQQIADLTLRAPCRSTEQIEVTHLAMAHSLCVALRERLGERGQSPARRHRLLETATS